jgi:hypothetical protein
MRPDNPREFFERWLPAEFAKAGGAPGIETLVRVELEGKGGGEWNLAVRGGKLEVVEDGEPDLVVAQSVDDWRATTDIAPQGASPRDMLMLDASTQQALAAIKGVVRFEVTGFANRTWQLTVAFGRGSAPARPMEPQSTITVDAETQKLLLAGKMMPPEAYFAGKIQIRGDANLAMQLGMAMMSRFSQRRPA